MYLISSKLYPNIEFLIHCYVSGCACFMCFVLLLWELLMMTGAMALAAAAAAPAARHKSTTNTKYLITFVSLIEFMLICF